MPNQQLEPLVINIGGVVQLTTMSNASIYRRMKEDPEFPKSKKIKGTRRSVWIRSEVEAWVMASLEVT